VRLIGLDLVAHGTIRGAALRLIVSCSRGIDQSLRELIRSFPSQGITVILSSHILSEVEQIADHIGIISNGMLGYQNEMNQGDDLEKLFMEVVGKSKNEVETYHD